MLGVSTYSIREGARIRENKERLSAFASEVFSLNLIFVSVAYVILLFITLFIPFFDKYRVTILIISSVILSTCIGRDWINAIFEDYLYITIRYIIIQIMGVFLIFCFIRESTDCIKYTMIYTLTSCAGFWVNLIYTQKYVPLRICFDSRIKRHIVPIFILFCAQIAVTIYIQSDITMVGLFLNDYNVGVYTAASKIYVLVKSLVNAITAVTIPRIVYYLGKNEQDEYNIFTKKISGYLLVLVIPLSIGLFFQSENLLTIIGGTEYLSGDLSLKILSVALPFAVFSGFYCNAILVPDRKEKSFMWITIIAAMINILGNIILIPLIGISGAALTTIFSESIVLILCVIITKKVYIKLSGKDIVSLLASNTVVVIICVLVKEQKLGIIIELPLTIILSVCFYFGTLFLLKNTYVCSFIEEYNKVIKRGNS